jgi:hypothetical protein
MKKEILSLLATTLLCSTGMADDIVIYRRSVNLTGTEIAESTAPAVTGLRPFTGRLTEVQYEIIDLTNDTHVVIEVYAVDPITKVKGYIKNPEAPGRGYSVMRSHPAGTEVWFNGRVFKEETAEEDQVSTLLEVYEELGKAAPTRLGTKTLTVPTRIAVVRDGIDQFSNSIENLRGSVSLGGGGAAVLDRRLSSGLAASGVLEDAVQVVTALLISQGFAEIEE